jgi:hypothetical protein
VAELPLRLEISLSLGGESLPGGWVLVDLPMFWKNPYGLFFGPTNEIGVVVVTRDDLSKGAYEIAGLFPMDYMGLGPDYWSGEVLLRPANLPATEGLRQAFATWGEAGIYPSDFLEQMDALQERLRTVDPNTKIKLSLLADAGGDADIKISWVRVSELG